jgi:CRP-like cAMP-binding protein
MTDRERPEPPEGYERYDQGDRELSETEKAWLEEEPEDYEWMTEMDKKILRVLMTNLTLTPSVIADNIGHSRQAVSRRLNMLRAGGLIEKEERGKYTISKKGFGFMEIGKLPEDGNSENKSDG